MEGLVENVSEIAKVTNYRGRPLTRDEMCSEKTGVNAKKNKCRNRREKYWF